MPFRDTRLHPPSIFVLILDNWVICRPIPGRAERDEGVYVRDTWGAGG